MSPLTQSARIASIIIGINYILSLIYTKSNIFFKINHNSGEFLKNFTNCGFNIVPLVLPYNM